MWCSVYMCVSISVVCGACKSVCVWCGVYVCVYVVYVRESVCV